MFLPQNSDSDGHFEMLNGSVPYLVLWLWHKMLKFLFLVFTDFVRKKTLENDAVEFFQFIIDDDSKKPLKIIITEF